MKQFFKFGVLTVLLAVIFFVSPVMLVSAEEPAPTEQPDSAAEEEPAAPQYSSSSPYIIYSNDNHLTGYHFTANSSVTITIPDLSFSTTDETGGTGILYYDLGVLAVEAGMTINATCDGVTKSITVPDIAITEVNQSTVTVSGTASTSLEGFQVWASDGQGFSTTVSVSINGDGTWSAVFSSYMSQIESVLVSLEDNENDEYTLEWRYPRLDLRADYIGISYFPPSSAVTVTVPGISLNTSINTDSDGWGYLILSDQNMAAGMTVTATSGSSEASMVIPDILVSTVNQTSLIVTGTGPADYEGLWVMGSSFGGSSHSTTINIDSLGDWSVDFTGSLDSIRSVDARYKDQYFNSYTYEWDTPYLNLHNNSLGLYDFTPYCEVTVTVPDLSFSDTVTVANSGNAQFDFGDLALAAGMDVTAVCGEITKTLTIPVLEITEIDQEFLTISGKGPAGYVGLPVRADDGGDGYVSTKVDVAGDGTWSLDVSHDLSKIEWAATTYTDEDGDQYYVNWNITYIEVAPTSISMSFFPENSDVVVTVPGISFSETVTTNDEGHAELNFSEPVTAGMTVTATSGDVSKSLVVPVLTIGTVNQTSKVVTGTGPADYQDLFVLVCQDEIECRSDDVAVDASGNWSVDFSWGVTHIHIAEASYKDADSDEFSLTWRETFDPDSYEDDDVYGTATLISNGDTQTHSIDTVDDIDWVKFDLNAASAVKIWTTGTEGETELYLYDDAFMQIAYDDTSGENGFSVITMECGSEQLPAETYYVKVTEGDQDDTLESYDLHFEILETCLFWTDEFGYGQGWENPATPRTSADVNGDGINDLIGFSPYGVQVALGDGVSFEPSSLWLVAFGSDPVAGSWSGDTTIRTAADVNGDGMADIVGFGNYGVLVSLSTGTGFGPSEYWSYEYGSDASAGSWSSVENPRVVADVNGDGKADVVGFGDYGVLVSLSTGTGFAPGVYWAMGYGRLLGDWDGVQNPRMIADINGDGCGDVVGFGNYGVVASLSNACSGTPANTFGVGTYWAMGYGYLLGDWDATKHIRTVGDVDGDGNADIFGFGNYGVLISISDGGSNFIFVGYGAMGYGYVTGGWDVNQHPRMISDVNGDGKGDIVGYATDGVLVELSHAGEELE